MSYSFTVRAATKTEALAKVAAELDKVVSAQPDHSVDRDKALAAATAFVEVLADDADRDVVASVNGWLNWNGNVRFTGACVGVSASLSNREV
jgi:hypothetical protein